MGSRHLKQYAFPPLCLLIILLTVRTAEACSCLGPPTVLDAFNTADVVVVVTAVSVEKAEPEKTAPPGRMSDGNNYVDGVKSTTMRVEQVFKGTLKVGEEMIFFQGGGGDCIWAFSEESIGTKFLFYLHRYEESTHWAADTCGRSRPVEFAGDDLLYLNKRDKVRNKTRISGSLRFLHDAGDSNAGLKIRIAGTKRTHELKTDANGVFEIYDLPAGRYYIEPEVPSGWKVSSYWLRYSPSVDRNPQKGSQRGIPVVLEAKKHAGLDLMLEIDNAIRGHIYDPLGQPMNDVCLRLVPADGSKGAYLADCTEKEGAFNIDKIPPGAYVILVNDDGKKTSSEPFGAFYYPKATRREEATVFNIGLGDFVENLEIHPTIELETITVEGMFVYSDGKPVVDESVSFQTVREKSDDKDDPNDTGATTDRDGRFSIKIVKGSTGSLFGRMFTYVGEFENCPKLDSLIQQMGSSAAKIETPRVDIRATTNLYEVELKFPFPSCKRKPREN